MGVAFNVAQFQVKRIETIRFPEMGSPQIIYFKKGCSTHKNHPAIGVNPHVWKPSPGDRGFPAGLPEIFQHQVTQRVMRAVMQVLAGNDWKMGSFQS